MSDTSSVNTEKDVEIDSTAGVAAGKSDVERQTIRILRGRNDVCPLCNRKNWAVSDSNFVCNLCN
jgi:hypothetical protein